jgi:hypothetical protein
MKRILFSLALIIGFGIPVLAAVPVGAINVFQDACSGQTNNTVCNATAKDDVKTVIKNIINTLLYVLGAVAVIVIVIAGILYVISGGETANVTKAKNMLLYAIIGLVVAILAYAIVNFVIARFGK